MSRPQLLLACALPLLLSACAGPGPAVPSRPAAPAAPTPTSPTAPGGEPGSAACPGAPPSTPLAMEQRFLEDWFRGTPVVIASQPPTTLQLDVPLAHSFDAGKADVKPALNAVLERVAQSLLRHPGARIAVTAPADATGPAALAQARAQRVRDNLSARGIAATRVSMAESLRPGGALQLRLSMPAVSSQPAAARRGEGDNGALGGVHPVSTQRHAAPAWTEKKQP